MFSFEKIKSLLSSPRKIGWLLAGISAVSLFAIYEWQYSFLSDETETTITTSPDSLGVYMLRENDVKLVVELESLRQTSAPDSFGNWVGEHYVSLQSIGLRLLEQATLWRVRQNTQLADAKLAKARELGQVLAESAKDLFLLQQVEYLLSLSEKELRQRSIASIAFATAYDTLHAGKYDAAMREFRTAYKLARRAHDEKLSIESMSMLQYFLSRDDKYREVIDLGEQIMERAERIGYERRLAIALYQVGEAYRDLDLDHQALKYIDQAIKIASSMNDKRVSADCYLVQAQVYYRMEKYEAAEEALNNMIAAAEGYAGYFSLHLAQICVERGEYGKAQDLYEEALKIFQQRGDKMNLARTLDELSFLHLQIGDYETALDYARQVKTLLMSDGSAEKIALALGNLGFIYDKMDSLTKALKCYQDALQQLQGQGKRYRTDLWLHIGEAEYKRKNWRATGEAFSTAYELANTTDYQLGKAGALIGQGQIALQQAEPHRAHDNFISAAAIADKIEMPSLKAAAFAGLSRVAKELGDLKDAAFFIEKAVTTAESLRTAIYRDSLRVSYFATIQKLFDEAISIAVNSGKKEVALHYAERAQARALFDALGNSGVKELHGINSSMQFSQVPPIDTLLKRIPHDLQILEYRVTQNALYIWLLSKGKSTLQSVPVSSTTLEQKVQRFLQSIGGENLEAFRARVKQNVAEVYHENRQLGRELYELLAKPIAEEIAPGKPLYIIADGPLHRLPFGALVTDEELFFDESYAWVRVPSLTILSESTNSPRHVIPVRESRFLMVTGHFPSTLAQIKTVKRLFAEATILEDEMASFENLRKSLDDSQNILYMSVHSVSDAQRPLNSYIEFYDDLSSDGQSRWRKIYARQLLQLDFSKTWLAVLNACETGNGKIVQGEGSLNMVRVFSMARIPLVIASLWQNDDRRSADIMDTFFDGLCKGIEASEALQQAKKNTILLLKTYSGYPLPYFWATLEAYQNQWPNKIMNGPTQEVVSVFH
jgi:CHAT domain-containing protein